jgi:hypothetical protein
MKQRQRKRPADRIYRTTEQRHAPVAHAKSMATLILAHLPVPKDKTITVEEINYADFPVPQ